MKGILFNILSDLEMEVLWNAMSGRVFGPMLKIPGVDNSRSGWTTQMVGTFADLAAIEEGDKVFFFKDKTIYGVGEVIAPDGCSSPAVLNFPDALMPVGAAELSADGPAGDTGLYSGDDWEKARLVVPFRESPAFFKQGVDMDYLLSARETRRSPYLEFFEGKNFSLLSESETRALSRLVWMVNRDTGSERLEMAEDFEEFESRLDDASTTDLDFQRHVASNSEELLDDDGLFSKENWVHGLAIEALRKENTEVLPEDLAGRERRQVFREFPTSPAKPTSWANHLDILTEVRPAAEQLENEEDGDGVTVGYELIEVKKDEIRYIETLADHIGQLMKYVDYIAENYAEGHYHAIDAYLLTGGYSVEDDTYREEVLQAFENRSTPPFEREVGQNGLPPVHREYVMAHNPGTPELELWNSVHLLEYGWNDQQNRIEIRHPKGLGSTTSD